MPDADTRNPESAAVDESDIHIQLCKRQSRKEVQKI